MKPQELYDYRDYYVKLNDDLNEEYYDTWLTLTDSELGEVQDKIDRILKYYKGLSRMRRGV